MREVSNCLNTFLVTIQPCIKTVWDVIARSVLYDEAIPKRSSWPDKWEIAYPSGTLRGRRLVSIRTSSYSTNGGLQ